MNIGVVMYQTSFSKGQELVAQRMVHELIKQGHKALLIAGPYHDNSPIREFKRLERSVEGYLAVNNSDFNFPIVRVGGYASGWPPRRIMFRDFLDVLRRLVEKFSLDTIISHSTLWNGPEWIAKYISWERMMRKQGLDQRKVTFCHMSHYQPPDPARYDVMERAYRSTWNSMVLPHIFDTASLILCTTPLEVEQMVQLGCPKKKCHLYLSGVDEEAFSGRPNDHTLRKRYNIPDWPRLVTYLGTIEERKNPLAVVHMAKYMRDYKDVHFVVAGFPSNQSKQVKEEAQGLPNVSYIGELKDQDKAALIDESYLNVILSHMEALGLTQIEFMYRGVPIVTSAVGGQSWLIRDGIDGIHVRGAKDINGAIMAVRNLLEDPRKRDTLGRNAKLRAKEFTLEKMTKSLVERLSNIKDKADR
ncbi:MAG: glycosyltransferase family 4 protein [Candidatus Bathyarchaeota archaeon]|nr:glycosyltransferase family 4 protein [Candidatus Bathyarchaeota archaeon]